MIYQNTTHEISRGEIVTSSRALSRRWLWSRNRVARFLKANQQAGQIRTKVGPKSYRITICNYDKYQGERTNLGPETDQPRTNLGPGSKKIRTKEDKKKTKTCSPDAERLLALLNELGNNNFVTAQLIEERLSEGFTPEQGERVIRNKAAAWVGNEKMDKYFCPKTLFGKENFREYIGESKVAPKHRKKLPNSLVGASQEMIDDWVRRNS